MHLTLARCDRSLAGADECYRAGVIRREPPDPVHVLALRAEGLSWEAMGIRLGVSSTTAKKWHDRAKEGRPLVRRPGRRPGTGAEKEQRTCSVAGCDRRHAASGLCMTHYQQRRRARKRSGTRRPRTDGRDKPPPRRHDRDALPPFVALDFETADPGRDSACAIALVRVEGGRITDRAVRLIRPPRTRFHFTYIHGIRWADVAAEPAFPEVWRDLAPFLDGAAFIAAHNAPFDRSVLHACCARYRLESPRLHFVCTVQLARRAWSFPRNDLATVARHLDIPLVHHDPASDAEACARIVLAAAQAGTRPTVLGGAT